MSQPLHIAVLTTARSDYWIWRPVLAELRKSPCLRVSLLVSGAHLTGSEYGSLAQIERDDHLVLDRVPLQMTADNEVSVTLTHGSATQGFACSLEQIRPDLLFVLGDRLETHAAVCAATPLRIPVAHLHGGELTYGAIDDAFRHSITKLSHLHFVSTEAYGARVRQMGEPADRVVVCGAPALDGLVDPTSIPDRQCLHSSLKLPADLPFVLVAFHPVTLEEDSGQEVCRRLLDALRQHPGACLITGANIDHGGRAINDLLRTFCAEDPARRWFRDNLGQSLWFAAMREAEALIGNSSSGILEAASFGLPVVNVGTRQKGRVTAANVVSCGTSTADIRQAIETALTPAFADLAKQTGNPYSKGGAAPLIREKLESIRDPRALLNKPFVDFPG